MRAFKILKIKSGQTIQKALSLKDEFGEKVLLSEYIFSSQIRNSRGVLYTTATFEEINPYLGMLTFTAESTKPFVANGRMTEILYMDVAVRLVGTDIIIFTETLQLDVDRGITEV